MRTFVVGVPRFHLEVARPLVEDLKKLAQHHYDYACRSTARGEGVLHRWVRHLNLERDMPVSEELDDATRPFSWPTATFRELDLLVKLTEMASLEFVGQREALERLAEFRSSALRALQRANVLHAVWQSEGG